jgi:hypothetical protein
MGVAATATPLDGVDRTAAAYLETIERVRRNAPGPAVAR